MIFANRIMATFILICALVPISLFAKDQEFATLVDKPYFEPENFFIGDRVICVVKIEADDNQTVAWDSSLNLIERNDFYIEQVKVINLLDGYKKIEIHFIPFYSQFKLPSLNLGDVKISEIDVVAFANVISQGGTAMKIRKQKNITHIENLFYLILFVLLASIILILSLYKKVAKGISHLLKRKKQISPSAYANDVIKELQGCAKKADPKEFYIKLSSGVRGYLSLCFSSDFYSSTTKEITTKLSSLVLDNRVILLVSQIMEFSDQIKFGKKRATFSLRRKDINRFMRLVSIVQSHAKKMGESRGGAK